MSPHDLILDCNHDQGDKVNHIEHHVKVPSTKTDLFATLRDPHHGCGSGAPSTTPLRGRGVPIHDRIVRPVPTTSIPRPRVILLAGLACALLCTLIVTPASAFSPSTFKYLSRLTGEETPSKVFSEAEQVAFAPDGDIYVIDRGRKVVDIFKESLVDGEYEYTEKQLTGFELPYGIAIDQSNGDVYVADDKAVAGKGAVDVFESSGTKIGQITEANSASFGKNLRDIAIDQANKVLYVTDLTSDAVDEFSTASGSASNASYVEQITKTGESGESFGETIGVAVDQANNDVYVADGGEIGGEAKQAVDKFAILSGHATNSSYVSQLTGPEPPSRLFKEVAAVTVDSYGNVYVAEGGGGGKAIDMFKSSGAFISGLTGSEIPEAQGGPGFKNPVAVVVQPITNNLFISDENANQLDVFAVVATKFPLTVTKNGTGGGAVECNTGGGPGVCATEYNEGTKVKLIATAAGGSVFAGWSEACSGTGACEVTMSAAMKVTATFNTIPITKFPLTVTKNGTGSGAVECNTGGGPGVCATEYNQGTKVMLIATPASGSTFAGWSGACSGTGICEVTLAAATSVAATFTTEDHVTTITPIPMVPPPIVPPPPATSPSNKFTATATVKGAVVTLKLTLPGPGAVSVASNKELKGARANLAHAGVRTLKLNLTAAGEKALKKKGKLRLKVTISFEPTGGTVNSVVKAVTFRAKRGR